MTDFNQEYIKSVAVKIVEGYLNNKVPLSEGVALVSSTDKLNPEQVKRLVEATNQITYLKLFGSATDKTFEFPVAKYNEVLLHMSTPQAEKTASASTSDNPLSLINDGMVKQAGVVESSYFSSMTDGEKTLLVKRAFDSAISDREQLEVDLRQTAEELSKKASSLDPEVVIALDYILCKQASEQEAADFRKLIGIEKQASTIVDNLSMNDAENLYSLYKRAKEITTKIDSVDASINKCASFFNPSMTPLPPSMLAAVAKAGVKGTASLGKGIVGTVMNHATLATNLVMAPSVITHKNDVLNTLKGGMTY